MFPQIAASANLLRMVDRAVFVGIGYPSDQLFDTKRRYFDLTPPTSAEALEKSGRADSSVETGGNDQFLAFIQDELKPSIQSRWKIDLSQQSLFGHSLGGLFVLHTLCKEPDAFQIYLAAAPSVWWNENSILEEIRAFRKRLSDSTYRLLVMTNTDLSHKSQRSNSPESKLASVVDLLRIESKAEIQERNYEDETHISMVAPSIMAALRFALGDTPRNRQ